MENILQIHMLGTFSIEKNGQIISDRDNRSRKMWALLAYLFYFHEKKISQTEIFATVWKDEDTTANPGNVLKVLLHRTRAMLNELDETLGKELIISSKGEYYLNSEVPFTIDILEFEKKILSARQLSNSIDKISWYLEAIQLYKGDFLEHFVGDTWIVPIATYYHELYIQTLEELLFLYDECNQYKEIIALCQTVCSIERYEESIYLHYMQALIKTEQYLQAADIYSKLRQTLYSEFGIQPSDELQALFRQARQGLHTDVIDISDVHKLMHIDDDDGTSALFCELDIFKQIYHFSSRGLERNGTVIHLILINVTDINGQPLVKRSLTVGTKNLRNLLCNKLRRGDIVSMCSPSQFLVLLPNANYENTEKVMQRLLNSFYQQYPHTPVKLNYYIQPVIPDSEFDTVDDNP